ncbi:interferon-induced very large GTPase 1-like [Chanos chanos]|uniref:Interferon-induced very large GTPase 1-like n=1 Tax=Chanos chanos TaxID=29144 RepID=A0A6J2VTV5_CHACN|nr:interferon-induced very large GTPase 1-like [Chanos chanos]
MGFAGASVSAAVGAHVETDSNEQQIEVQLFIHKTGGPAEVDNHKKWKQALATNNKTWAVIDRGLTLTPIWEIIKSSHMNDFKDTIRLCRFLMNAYKEITGQDSEPCWGDKELRLKKEVEEMMQSVEKCPASNAEKGLTQLLEMKRRILEETHSSTMWIQCLSNKEIQKFLMEVTMAHNDKYLRVLMQSVMEYHCNDVEDFPNRSVILKWINEQTQVHETKSDIITSVSNFSELEPLLKTVRDNLQSNPSQETKISATCTVTNAFNSFFAHLEKSGHGDLLLLLQSVICLVGYKRETFDPIIGLPEVDFLLERLSEVHRTYCALREMSLEKAQAYTLLTILTVSHDGWKVSPLDKKERLERYMLKMDSVTLPAITAVINCFEVHKRWKELEGQLMSLTGRKTVEEQAIISQKTIEDLQKSVNVAGTSVKHQIQREEQFLDLENWRDQECRKLLERLDLLKYYPRKITTADLLLIRSMSVKTSVDMTESELWTQYICKLMVLDRNVRYLCCKNAKSDVSVHDRKTSDYFSFESETCFSIPNEESHIHPMDIHMAVFHCADNYARQRIFAQLTSCQFAVPLLVPDPSTQEIEVPLWALQQIKKTWQSKSHSAQTGGNVLHHNKYIISVPVPVVSFIRLGTSSNSKSEILNGIINRKKHPTFFSRHCSGSTNGRLLLDGVTEISWYCPGGKENDIFENCIAFINLHGDAVHFPKQLEFLCRVSTVIVLLLSENPLEPEAKKTADSLLEAPPKLVTLFSGAEKTARREHLRVAAKNRNEAELTEEIISSLKYCLSGHKEMQSVENHIAKAIEQGLLKDTKDELLHEEEPQRLYMLLDLEKHLDELFRDVVVELKKQYHLKWAASRQTVKTKEDFDIELTDSLSEIGKKIKSATFGLQHIIREIAQIYEAFKSVGQIEDCYKMDVNKLPTIAAEILLSGYPLELMDGDVNHVPLDWISAVLKELLNKLGDRQIFVLSVLGAQSSGKSTLLNTMFGLQFPVSAGQCTRGAFMQLLSVDENMRDQVHFDFILVLDTEGLRSLQHSHKTVRHDNELATFIVGIGDLTIVNIMGENLSDIQDILQICFQAFVRMKSVKIKPRCIFVHQNVSESNAKDKNQEGRRQLVEKLDEISKMAAEEENLKVDGFSDIIQFDVDTQVFYFKNLFEGDPPMAPPNPSYSWNIQELKTKILSISEWQPGCKFPTLSELQMRISDLWNALLKEDFLFHFRNTLDIAVYNKLEYQCGKWSWELRKHALETQNNLHHKIMGGELKSIDARQINDSLDEIYHQLKLHVENYFKENKHADILVQWRTSTNTRLYNLKNELFEETKVKAKEFLVTKEICKEIDKRKAEYEAELFNKSKALASDLGANTLNDEELRNQFSKLWTALVTKVSAEKPTTSENPSIQSLVEHILTERFMKNTHLIREDKGVFRFDVDKHVKLSHKQSITTLRGMFNINNLTAEGNSLTKEIENHIDALIAEREREKLDVGQAFIYELLNEIEDVIGKHQASSEIKLTELFKDHISIHVCSKVVPKLTEIEANFKKFNDPLTYLNSLKEDYFEIFRHFCKGATSISLLVDVLGIHIKSTLFEAVFDKATIQIVEKLKSSHPVFSGPKSCLEDHILKYLASKEDFSLYMEYIQEPKKFTRTFITEQVEGYLSDASKVLGLLKSTLSQIIDKVLIENSKITAKIEETGADTFTWIKEFSSKLRNVMSVSTFDFSDIENIQLLEKDVKFLKESVASLLAKIRSDGKEDLESMLTSCPPLFAKMRNDGKEDLKSMLTSCPPLFRFRNRLGDILFKEMSGCWEQCPFCGAVCTNSIPGHDTDHSVKWHRSIIVKLLEGPLPQPVPELESQLEPDLEPLRLWEQ